MDNCKISIYLAYAMAVYSIASMFYLVATRSIGTPFRDSLTPEQIVIKKKAKKLRGGIFQTGLLVALGILFVAQPFKKCN